MKQVEQFCKLNGIEPTYKFLIGLPSEEIYPTFTDAKSILEVMMKREDFIEFTLSLYESSDPDFFHIDYILNPDKLLDEAIRFCEKCT